MLNVGRNLEYLELSATQIAELRKPLW